MAAYQMEFDLRKMSGFIYYALQVLKRANILVDLWPLLLSHHAFCRKFEGHVIKVRNVRICLGCISIYPAFIIATVALFILRDTNRWRFPTMVLLVHRDSLRYSPVHPIHTRAVHTMFNAGTGAGTGMMFVGLMLSPMPWVLRLSGPCRPGNACVLPLFRRFMRHLRICDKVCRYQRNWSRCPGFKKDILEDRTGPRIEQIVKSISELYQALSAHSPLCGFQGVLHKHGNGHRANTLRHRGYEGGLLGHSGRSLCHRPGNTRFSLNYHLFLSNRHLWPLPHP